MTKKGMFVPFKATDFDKVPDEVKDPNGNHVAQRLNVMAIYVRDDILPAADRPKTWTDLINPKYKGKIVMPDPSSRRCWSSSPARWRGRTAGNISRRCARTTSWWCRATSRSPT